ncbi:MAG TPA: winged helix-turn-helix domain-containing protein, partial [Pseudonocardiaceae bacterium]|nr:winged helix-turn-helix domain-containing protein [Pseudonocardiaceae bacterium]
LREQITSGALPSGSLLPSETELMSTYGVSRPTARAAFQALRNQGLITVLPGKGSFVRRLAPAPPIRTPAPSRAPRPRSRQAGGRPSTKAVPAQRWDYRDADDTEL